MEKWISGFGCGIAGTQYVPPDIFKSVPETLTRYFTSTYKIHLYNTNNMDIDVDQARTSSMIRESETIVCSPFLVFCRTVVDAVCVSHGGGLVGASSLSNTNASSVAKFGKYKPSLTSSGLSDFGSNRIIIHPYD